MLLCRYLLLCEYISTGSRARVTIHCVFNGINAIDFPASQEPFAVTIEVSALCRAVLDEELAIQIVALDERHEEVVLQIKAVSRWHRGRPTHRRDTGSRSDDLRQGGRLRVKFVADDRPLIFRDLAVRRTAQSGEV